MYKRLLVAVDGSAAADRALARAIELAAKNDAEVRLVHVVDETAVGWDEHGAARRERALAEMSGDGAQILADARAALRAAGRVGTSMQIVRSRWRETVGDLIAAEGRRWGADLIVIGSRGRGPIRRALLGSVDAAVMRVAAMPVLPVQAQGASRPPARPTPGYPHSAPRGIGLA